MNKQALYEIGLTKGEVEVYLALIKIGGSSIGNIVKESKVTKSKVYDILDRLIDKGLVSKSLKNSVQHYNAAPPNFLLEFVEKKEEEIEENRKEIGALIPSLLNLGKSSSEKQRAEIFEGFRGLKNAFKTVENEFEEGEEFLVFGVGDTLTQQQLNFFINYHKEKVKAKIKTKVIFTSNLRGVKEYHLEKNKYNEERYLNQATAVPINIYKDIVIIPILEKGEKEITILLRNEKLAKGLREYFYTLWKISKI